LVFEAGQIVEQGSHAQLISDENGIYAHLFKMQSGGLLGV
jgi:ABC-type multidrug transport system fused ATPase/permease subunit